MIHKLTLTIPNDLYESLEKVRKRFNISEVCANAIRSEIKIQEETIATTGDNANQIAGLRKQQQSHKEEHFMCGTSPGSVETFKEQVCMPINGRVECIDKCIHHIVASLNAGNVRTVASCCGHKKMPGSIILEDGRWLGIFASKEEWEVAEKAVAKLRNTWLYS